MRPEDLARGWVGTPYRHQAACRGVGADCLGLVRGVWRELYGTEVKRPPPYTEDWAECAVGEPLWRGLAAWLVERERSEVGAGDVLLFRMRAGCAAKHVGIVTRAGSDWRFVHAFSGRGVVETGLSETWRRRIVAGFAFP